MRAKASLDLSDDREIKFVRLLNAPRALVWRAWTDPERLAAWWGPRFFDNPECVLDLKPGGAYRIVMRGPDGAEYPIKGKFVAIIAGEKLVMTIDLAEHDAEFHAAFNAARGAPAGTKPLVMTQTVTFEDAGAGKTNLTVTQRYETRPDRDASLKVGAETGWRQSFVKLDAELARMKRAA